MDGAHPHNNGQRVSPGATMTMTERTYDTLLEAARSPVESAAVLLAQVVETTDSGPRLYITAVRPVPDDAYQIRTERRLEIASDGYMHSLGEAERTNKLAIWTHTHPGSGARVMPSEHDQVVNSQLHDVFAIRSRPRWYGWLVLGHDRGVLTFTGGIRVGQQDSTRISRITVTGGGLRRISASDESGTTLPDHGSALPVDLFDRNIRALGSEVQKVIHDLVFAVVGAGGTGSAVAEQLVRLGARHLMLIDPDVITISNVTRVYGSTPNDVNSPKAEALARHLTRIAPDLNVDVIQGTVNSEAVARRLLNADVVFGCTDDNAGRLRLSRLPYYYYIPVIDCGVLLDADADHVINGVFGRVTVLHPGTACLMCRGRIDIARAEAEVRSPEAQAALEREGYAPALPGVEPALVPFTTMTAAWALSELVERLIGYGEDPRPSELILRVHDRVVNANFAEPNPGHYCHHDTELEYDDGMFLGMNWSA